MFYKFNQNNSGGSFVEDDQVASIVIIEANSAEEANDIAQQHGIYFDGVRDERDCPCCGDRWYEVRSDNALEVYIPTKFDGHWAKEGEVYGYIYMLNGEKHSLIKGRDTLIKNKGANMEYPEELYDHTSPAYKDTGKIIKDEWIKGHGPRPGAKYKLGAVPGTLVEMSQEELDNYLAQSPFPNREPKQEQGYTDRYTKDMVNHPPHYTSGGIETIDYMEAKSTPEEFKGHLRLTALKYLSRVGMKDDILQEYEKAEWYLKKLIAYIKMEREMHKIG